MTVSSPVYARSDQPSRQSRSGLDPEVVRVLPVFIILALVFFASRLHSLSLMPLHFDEEVHLSRALEVWRGHPFWNISDGRIINQWAIALFYPQNVPVFAARIATVLVALPGFAAGYAIARRWFGTAASLIAAVLWIGCPYLFFYERTALVDGESGALAVVAIWACLKLTRMGTIKDAVIAGLSLSVAILFKFTALPFVGTVIVLVLFFGSASLRARIRHLLIIGLTGVACFIVPIAYAALHNGFGTAAGWLGGSGGGQGFTPAANLGRLTSQFLDYGLPVWSLTLIIGLVYLVISHAPARFRRGAGSDGRARANALLLLLACALPLAFLVIAISDAQPRHFVTGVPILIVLGGAGLGAALDVRPRSPRLSMILSGVVALVLLIGFAPFALTAYSAPGSLVLPPLERQQYQTGYSSGFGLRDAVLSFPATVGPVGTPIIASMYPDGCRLANFYDTRGYAMRCTDAPGLDAIRAAVAAQPSGGAVFVLAEPTPIGLDPAWLKALPGVTISRVAGYPRPGESPDTASVVLWKIQK